MLRGGGVMAVEARGIRGGWLRRGVCRLAAVGLELPEAFGVGVAAAEGAEAEDGEVGQDYQEDHQGDSQEKGCGDDGR